MATVVYGDYEPFEIDDNRADLVAYYRSEGATVTLDREDEVTVQPVDVTEQQDAEPQSIDLPVPDVDATHGDEPGKRR